jgi:DNA-binding LacI/PurR family transcriptional regulator
VLNDRVGVSDETRVRIRAIAADLGWRPRPSARGLSTSRAYALGLVHRCPPDLLGADPSFAQFLAGVEEVLGPKGYALVLQVIDDHPEVEQTSYWHLTHDGRVDGVFVLDLRLNDPRFALLEKLGLAAVAVGRPEGKCGVPVVALDDRPGMRQAVEHLIDLGHERIAHVAGTSGYVHTAARRSVWRETLRRAGLTPGPVAGGSCNGRGGAKATTRVLDSHPRPTAIVYANDLMALAGIGSLQAAGLRVPEDVSVMGYDDVPLAGYAHPPLSTVRQDVGAWGRAAATALLAVVEGRPPPVSDLPRPRLVLRDSTAPPSTKRARA